MSIAEIVPYHRPDPLECVEGAKAMLAQATQLDEVIQLRDQAEAVRKYVAIQKGSLEAQNQAAEVKLWAERRAGELIALMPKQRPGEYQRLHDESLGPKLSDIGVSHIQSHRWQRIARLPEAEFVEHIEATKDAGKELTTASVLKLAAQVCIEPRPTPTWDEAAGGDVVSSLTDLISSGRKFSTIYADPPWRYGNQATRASTDNHYPTMTVEAICAEPVCAVAEDDAHLHLWTTNGFLRDAFAVMEAWGFAYKSMLIWCKPQMGIGNYWRVSHEILLFGMRGNQPFLAHDEKSWIETDRTQHSAKPDMFRSKVEKVSPGPFLEMYGRAEIPNSAWTVYGNQVGPRLF